MNIISNQHRPQTLSSFQHDKSQGVDREQAREVAVFHMEKQQHKASAEQYMEATLSMNGGHENANKVAAYPLWQDSVKNRGMSKAIEEGDMMHVAVLTAKKQALITGIFREIDGPTTQLSNTINISV